MGLYAWPIAYRPMRNKLRYLGMYVYSVASGKREKARGEIKDTRLYQNNRRAHADGSQNIANVDVVMKACGSHPLGMCHSNH